MIFKGKYCDLRPLKIEDAEMTLKWRLSNRARYLQQGSTTVEQQEKWIASKLLNNNEYNFIIEVDGNPVGMISIVDINNIHKTCSIARLLIGEKEFIGTKPVAYESELMLSDYIFDVLNLHKIYGDVMEDNHAMLKFRDYVGYKRDGILRDHYVSNNNYKNTFAFSILEDEYHDVCRKKLLSLIKLYSRIQQK
jgi:diamine N-acetyltransferase